MPIDKPKGLLKGPCKDGVLEHSRRPAYPLPSNGLPGGAIGVHREGPLLPGSVQVTKAGPDISRVFVFWLRFPEGATQLPVSFGCLG